MAELQLEIRKMEHTAEDYERKVEELNKKIRTDETGENDARPLWPWKCCWGVPDNKWQFIRIGCSLQTFQDTGQFLYCFTITRLIVCPLP